MVNASAGRSAIPTWGWMIAALVVVGVFLVWLGVTSEPSAIAVVEEEDATEVAEPGFTGTVVTAAQFETSVGQYLGQEIQLSNVSVQDKMGTQVLWIELPSGSPYLVKTDPATAQGVATQSRVTVVGRVLQKTDSVLGAWEQSGVLQNPGHRAQAEFGSTFLEARTVRPPTGGT